MGRTVPGQDIQGGSMQWLKVQRLHKINCCITHVYTPTNEKESILESADGHPGDCLLMKCCISNSCHSFQVVWMKLAAYDLHDVLMYMILIVWFQSYAPFSKFSYILITCDKWSEGSITQSSESLIINTHGSSNCENKWVGG